MFNRFFMMVSIILLLSIYPSHSPAGTNTQTNDNIQIEISFTDNQEIDIRRNSSGMAVFSGKDLQYLTRSGEPSIPFKIIRVLLPVTADLSTLKVELRKNHLSTISNDFEVKPMPPITTWIDKKLVNIWPEGRTIENGRDVGVYQKDAFFPADLLGKISSGKLRQWKIVNIPVALIQYNPNSKKIKRLDRADLEIHFDYESREAAVSLIPDTIGIGRVKEIVINFEDAAPGYLYPPRNLETSSQQRGYAIITTGSMVNSSTQLDNFVAGKQKRGFTVHIITETAWGGGNGDTAAENIRTWLIGNYLGLSLQHVLLIGNPDPASGDVPMKMLWPRNNATYYTAYRNSPSDYYYADLTGDWDLDADGFYGEWEDDFGSGGVDRYYEVTVGRIPFYGSLPDDVAEIDDILAKVTAYEAEDSAQPDWRRNALLPMEPSDIYTPGYHLGEAIKDDIILLKTGLDYHRVYESNYGLDPPPETTPCTCDNVTNAWNSSTFGTVFWWTHGSPTAASDIMDLPHALTLDDNHPAFTFQCSCLNSHPETTNNLSYSLLKNGAIGTVGATRVSWYFPGQTEFAGSASNSGMTYEYAGRLITDNMSSGTALHDMKQYLSPTGAELWMNFTVFCLYGEPSLRVIPDCPEELVLQNISVDSGQSKIYQAASLIEAAGAGTYFINNGNVIFSGGNKIWLKAGFRSAVNSSFKAAIAPCGTFSIQE